MVSVPLDTVGVVKNTGDPPLKVSVEEFGPDGGLCIYQWHDDGVVRDVRDEWVSSYDELALFFAQKGWQVEWESP
jgi:hypothetical protein